MKISVILITILLILSFTECKKKSSKQPNYKFDFKSSDTATPESTTPIEQVQKPEYPSISKTKLNQQQQNLKENVKSSKKSSSNPKETQLKAQTSSNADTSLTIPQKPGQSPRNETFAQCVARVTGVSALYGMIGGGATAGVGSAATLSAAGFTTSGVASGSVAAAAHSAIGVAKAGSAFSYLQSVGALGQGVFGAAFLPVTLSVGAVAGGGYLAYECYFLK